MSSTPAVSQGAGMTPRKHLTYANVMATVAVVIATAAGTSYAAEKIKLPKNSVTSKQIKNGTIATKDLANGAVDGTKLNAGTLAGLSEPRAYGAVKADGTLIATRSKNATVTKLSDDGRYCVAAPGVDPLTTTIVAMPDYSDGNGLGHFVQGVQTATPTGSATCPGAFLVYTHKLDTGAAVPQNQGFTFVIP
jgi:hypothetical protein